MPGIPLVAQEIVQSRSGDQPWRQDSRVQLSAEEEIAAEESLSVYCKPVEFYNILQRRAIRNPLLLQRCLRYKVQVKHCRRIQMTVSLSGRGGNGSLFHDLFPGHIMLAKLVSDVSNLEHSTVYRYSKVLALTTPTIEEGVHVARANFILPEMNKLMKEVKHGSLFILFVGYGAAAASTSNGFDSSREHLDNLSFPYTEKTCLWGKIPMESLFLSWERYPDISREKADLLSTVDLHPCLVKSGFMGVDNCISFQMPEDLNSMGAARQVQVYISAEQQGARENSAYNPRIYNNVPASSSSHVMRLRTGNVIFNYRYYHNKLQRTEVTEDFSCAFCLVKCASFQGLKLHLLSFHDLFNFEFWVTEEYQAVNVSVKADPWRPEMVTDGVDLKQLIFFFCRRPLKRRKTKRISDIAKHVQPLTLTSEINAAVSELLNKADDAYSSRIEKARSSSINESQNVVPDPDCIQSLPGSSLAPPAMLQFAKTRKLSIERSDCRSRALLEKRQFFHSHRAQDD